MTADVHFRGHGRDPSPRPLPLSLSGGWFWRRRVGRILGRGKSGGILRHGGPPGPGARGWDLSVEDKPSAGREELGGPTQTLVRALSREAAVLLQGKAVKAGVSSGLASKA